METTSPLIKIVIMSRNVVTNERQGGGRERERTRGKSNAGIRFLIGFIYLSFGAFLIRYNLVIAIYFATRN